MTRMIRLPAIFLAALLCVAASLTLPSRQVSAEVDPSCQTMFAALKAATLASGALDQSRMNEVVACLNGTSTTPGDNQTNIAQPLAVSPAPITVTVRGTLYSLSFLFVPPVEFCDTLRANGSVDGGFTWGGSQNGGHYVQAAGREGWFFGPIALVTQQSLISSPTRWVTWWGLASVSSAPCP